VGDDGTRHQKWPRTIIPAYSQIMLAGSLHYSHLMQAENRDVIKQSGGCNQATILTVREPLQLGIKLATGMLAGNLRLTPTAP